MSLTHLKNSSGQVQQAFLFIMAVLVIVATIFLGLKLSGSLSKTACDVSDAEFRSDLRRLLDEHSTYGSRTTLTLSSPCDAVTVCFVDTTMIASPTSTTFVSEDPTIQTVVKSGVETNIFLRKEEGMLEAGYDPRIAVDNSNHYVCFNETKGTFSFRTEGLGRFIKIG